MNELRVKRGNKNFTIEYSQTGEVCKLEVLDAALSVLYVVGWDAQGIREALKVFEDEDD